MYLYLLAQYPSAVKHSEASMRSDLIWHTHMLSPKAYQSDSQRLLGFCLRHDPWPSQRSEEKGTEVSFEKLWKQEYGVSLVD